MRFLRFLRNDLSVKTSDRGRWLHQVNAAHAQSKGSSKLPSLCSTQPHIKGPLRPGTYYDGESNLCAGNPVSHRESLRTQCTYSRLVQLRKKRNKSKKEPVWCSSTGASGLPR
jgi:hypothetical protein